MARKRREAPRCHVPKLSMSEAIMKLKASDKPVMVQFAAEWCGACQQTVPEIEKASCSIGRNMEVVRVDVDELPLLANEFQVVNLPTVAIVRRGSVMSKTEGSASASHFKKMARDWLKDNGFKG